MSNQLEAAPNWDEIKLAARVLILPKFELDLSQLGLAQRMKYEEFELLFHHLFLLIDSQETRRRFKGPYPALDQEGRARFIESAVRFINDKQLHGQRVTSSQLRMYGGETFRRLIGSLIRIASERETAGLLSRQSIEEQVGLEQSSASLDILADGIEAIRGNILEIEEGLRASRDALAQLKARMGESKQQADEKWHNLTRELKNYSSPRDQWQASNMCTCLLSRLETSSGESKSALEKLKSMRLPHCNGAANKSHDRSQTNNEKRLSQFIREAKAHLNSNQQVEESNPNRLGERMGQQLTDFDEKMTRWLEMLRDEGDQADEVLLKNSEIRERYQQLVRIFPLIGLTPMTAPESVTFDASDFDSLAKVLADFPDFDCNSEQTLQIYQAVLNKRSKKN